MEHLGALACASSLLHSLQTPQRTAARVTVGKPESRQRQASACLSLGAFAPTSPQPRPWPSPCPSSGRLPINDRCALHNSLGLFPEPVCSADGHQGQEPPAAPHDTVPRRLLLLLLPAWLTCAPEDELGWGGNAEAFVQKTAPEAAHLSAVSTFPARVDRGKSEVQGWALLSGPGGGLVRGSRSGEAPGSRGRMRLRGGHLSLPRDGICLRSANKN